MAAGTYPVYKDSAGKLRVKVNDNYVQTGDPTAFGVRFKDIDLRSLDTLSIQYYGRDILTNKRVDQFTNEQGEVISPNVELSVLLEYFDSIGLGKPSVSGDYVDKLTYNADINALKARITALEQGNPPPVQLASPEPTQTAVTSNIATFSWGAVPNAEQYEVYKDGALLATITDTTYQAAGLTANTAYLFEVVAIADGYLQSDPGSVTITTQSEQPNQLATPVPVQASVSQTEATINWDPVGGTLYLMYKNGVQVGSTANTTYTFSGLVAGTQYTFGVRARKTGSLDSNIGSVTVTTNAIPVPGNNQLPYTLPFIAA